MFSFAASGEVNEKIKLESFSAVFFFSDTGESLSNFIHVTRESEKKSTEKKKNILLLKICLFSCGL